MARRSRHLVGIRAAYETVKAHCRADWQCSELSDAILALASLSLTFLTSRCAQVDLVSRVPGKQYFGFVREDDRKTVSRPVNGEMFILDPSAVAAQWRNWERAAGTPAAWAKLSYTVALAPCLALELFDRQNKKGPATYFECLIGHIFARALGTKPTKRASLRVGDTVVPLTMDFLFEGADGVRVHLPVKMSTRERVVQAWAHQRILDGAYGPGVYRGIMVLFSETKLDSRSHEVVEICVPGQWLVYQSLLARMARVYYFDVPSRYQALTDGYPELIQIRRFGEFFREKETVLRAEPGAS
jgi:hypothetical protein